MSGTLIKAPATCHKCNLRFINPTTGLVDSECFKCGGRIFPDAATGDTETLDLMRDEFWRIKNLTDNSEIRGLCDRAISGIQQHLPVLDQRDKYREDADRLRAENSVLREALKERDELQAKCKEKDALINALVKERGLNGLYRAMDEANKVLARAKERS